MHYLKFTSAIDNGTNQMILQPKMPFSVHQKCKFHQNFFQKSQILPAKNTIFCSSKSANLVDLIKFLQKINIYITTTSFHHFVSFSSKKKSFGAY